MEHFTHAPILRSKLFVPGSRPELFAKAAASACDAVSFDLEDSVKPEMRPEARAAIGTFLGSSKPVGKTTVIRVNPVSSAYFTDDMEALADVPFDVLNLPKVESAEEMHMAAKLLPVGTSLLATIETPRGLRLAHEIASAHARVVGLQIGFADLFGSTGIDRDDSGAVSAVRLRVRFAAAEAGVAAYDGAFLNVKDPDGFRKEAIAARKLGFAGKSCIHPTQIAIANEVFTPGADEIMRAQRIVEAATQAGSKGAFLLDGRMIDEPVIAHARAVIELAKRLGVLEVRP